MSKSVATIDNFLSFNSNRTFESIGRVFFFSTTLEQNLMTLIKHLF